MNTQTHKLLQIIGSPFVEPNKRLICFNANKLFIYSKNNRMPLLYLKSISKIKGYEYYGEEYLRLNNDWVNIEEKVKKVVRILKEEDIKFTTFKSIKPFREVTVDIDLLIMDSYEKTLKLLAKSDYILLQRGPLSSTFRDPEFRIDYDVYDEVGVSHIIYFDKTRVRNNVYEKPLVTGGYISSLTPEADLLAVVAHSVIKEQMYLLSEYYSTLYFVSSMSESSINGFIKMVDELKLRNAVRTHIGITRWLHRQVHGRDALPLTKIVSEIGEDNFEIKRLRDNHLKMPHKFHPLTLMRSFGDKLRDEKSRRSIATQFKNMANPHFLQEFIPDFLSHVLRETY